MCMNFKVRTAIVQNNIKRLQSSRKIRVQVASVRCGGQVKPGLWTRKHHDHEGTHVEAGHTTLHVKMLKGNTRPQDHFRQQRKLKQNRIQNHECLQNLH